MFKSYIDPVEGAEAKRKLPGLMVEGLLLGGTGLEEAPVDGVLSLRCGQNSLRGDVAIRSYLSTTQSSTVPTHSC